MNDILSVGVIGTGVIGREHMEEIVAIDSMRLAAVMDVDADRAHATAREFGAKAYTRRMICWKISLIMPPVRW